MRDRATEQPPLHSRLHQQRKVAVRLGLEGGYGCAGLVPATDRLGEQVTGSGGLRECACLLQNAVAMLVDADVEHRREQRVTQRCPHLISDPAPASIQDALQIPHSDHAGQVPVLWA